MNLRARRIVLLAIGLAIASPAWARTTTYSVFNELTRNIQSTLESASPYLFQVIRTQGDSTAEGRLIGTGVAIGGGRVLTSAGVVGPATQVWVSQGDKDMRRARVLGVDRRTDLAVIEVDGLNTPGIPVAPTSLVFPGHPVVAVGRGPRPGLTSTFGVVIVAGGPRLGFTETDVLQVSAPAFPGIAGGALLNLNGQLVGVVSGRLAFSPEDVVLPPGMDLVAGTFADGRFTTLAPNSATIAVPATVALDIARELTAHGRVERGYLGLQVDLIQSPTKKAQTLPGVLVHRVVSGSPAELAGLIPGDVILEYASTRVEDPENLSYLVGATLPGSDVSMLVLRRGVTNVTTVRIEQAPEPVWDPAMDEAIATFSGLAGVAPTVR